MRSFNNSSEYLSNETIINFTFLKLECGSSGPHFNPLKMDHGDRTSKTRHIGDYGSS